MCSLTKPSELHNVYIISTYSKEKSVSRSRGPGAAIVYTPSLPPNLVRMRGNEEPAC